MALYRCNTCLGEYRDIGSDGTPYAHVCPPVTLVRVTRNGKVQDIALTDLRGDDVVLSRRGDVVVNGRVDALERGDVRLGDTVGVRPNSRNENPRRGASEPGAPAAIIAEGAGRTKIAD